MSSAADRRCIAALPWLEGYKDWLESRARQNFWRGALLWWVKLIGGTPSQVTTKRNQYRQPPPPGSIVVTNDKEEWNAIENKANANDVAEDGRQIKLMSALNFGLPEYMLADGQNANLASASAQQLPALRTFSEYQDIAVNQVWRPIYRRVLGNAIEAGLLPEEVQVHDADGEPMYEETESAAPLQPGMKSRKGKPKMIATLDAFDLEAPELESDDPKSLSEALTIAVQNGWASNETAAGRAGYDYMVEQRKIEREEKTAQTRMYQGGAPVEGKALPDEQEPVEMEPQEADMNADEIIALVQEQIRKAQIAQPVNINLSGQPLAASESSNGNGTHEMLEQIRNDVNAKIKEALDHPAISQSDIQDQLRMELIKLRADLNVTVQEALDNMNVNITMPPINIPPIIMPEQPPAQVEVHIPADEKPKKLKVKRNQQGQIVSIEKEN